MTGQVTSRTATKAGQRVRFRCDGCGGHGDSSGDVGATEAVVDAFLVLHAAHIDSPAAWAEVIRRSLLTALVADPGAHAAVAVAQIHAARTAPRSGTYSVTLEHPNRPLAYRLAGLILAEFAADPESGYPSIVVAAAGVRVEVRR